MINTYLLNIDVLSDNKLYHDKFHIMSAYRQNKIRNYRYRIDQNLSLGAGILMDYGLRQYGLREPEMEYGVGSNNKPYFLNKPDIHFNISHSGTMVICTFSDKEIGVDMEKVTEKDIDIDIAKRFFCTSEFQHILNQDTVSKQKEAFYRLWVLKESFMKITGLGMSLLLNSFEFLLDHTITLKHTVDNQIYYFNEYKYDEYRVAVCSTLKEPDIHLNLIEL